MLLSIQPNGIISTDDMIRQPVRVVLLLITASLLSLLAASCFPLFLSPDQQPEAIYTAAASTVLVQLTLDAGKTAAAQLTRLAQATYAIAPPPKTSPTSTPRPPLVDTPASATQIPVQPTPTAVQSIPTAAITAAPCNWAEWLGDVTYPPDSTIPTGATFTKIWRARNIGSCTWTTGYALVFTGGNLTGSPPVVSLPAVVAPGQTVDLAVTLSAPSVPGVYQGTWMLRSDVGQLFGAGRDASVPLLARIQTYSPIIGRDYVLDIASNYCAATWSSAVGSLSCPGLAEDNDGFVLLVQNPALESGRVNDYGLWTKPNRDSNGWISGRTPPFTVRSDDHFLTEVGCLRDSQGCEVLFQLDYQTTDGVSGRLGRWRETYDGQTSFIDVDLSPLSGRTISLILSVYNRGQARAANAFWLRPRVQQGLTPNTYILVWMRENIPNDGTCDELRIFYSSSSRAVAIAYDCSSQRELGRANLNRDQLAQLQSWENRLDDFEGEVYAVSNSHAVTSWVIFDGLGSAMASEKDIQAVAYFAAQIFQQIVP